MAEEKKAAAPRRSTARKTTSTAKKTTTSRAASASKSPTKTSAVEKKVEANARHIEENAKTIENNSKLIHLLYGAIILLMMIIAGLAFFIGTQMWWGANNSSINNGWTTVNNEDIVITVIDDERCSDCQTNAIVEQLQALPFLSNVEFVRQDFSESGVSDFLIENSISSLPAIIFNSNALVDGGQITPYLQALPNGQYSLALWATFDPFATRSENGFLMASDDVISQIRDTAHFDGNADAEVTWLEFSDVNCFYCKKMAQDGTYKTVKENIPEWFNHSLFNFIGVGGASTQTAAEVLECIASVWGSEAYTSVFNSSLLEEKNSTNDLLEFANAEGVNTNEVQSCIDNGESKDIVAEKFALWRDTFGITGTPGNVIINMQTGEYEIVSGAYPADTFQETINKLLGE